MRKQSPTELLIEVKTEDGDPDEIDHLSRQLLQELRDIEVESAELVREDSLPKGAKSMEAVTLGAIVMAVLPNAVPKVIELIKAWIERGSGRRVNFKGQIGGKEVSFEGSAEDFKLLLESLDEKDTS